MHSALNTGSFHIQEPFSYHPHVTLVQGVPPEKLDEFYETAQRRWRESSPASSFEIDTLTFVQNTVENRWIDLGDCELRGEAAVSTR
jgi:hypothetical protein